MIYEKYIRVLYIDLTTGKIEIENREDLCEYLGGVGVAAKLFQENMQPELDPLEAAQPLVFAIGAATFMFPVVTKTVAVFRSPLTGEWGESYAGGRMALTMLLAGYDAMVIKGKAEKPSYLSVSRNNVEIKDARAMWGMSPDETGRLVRAREPGSGKRSIIRIGPAGEKLVKFASVCVDTYRHFGRLGIGAVFGSKNLKAISIVGDRTLPVRDFKNYFKVYQEIYKKVTDTEIMAKYHDVGTPVNVEPLNAIGGLPTRNLSQNRFEAAGEISGESFAKRHLVRKMACTGCPVGCIHIGQFRREFDKGYEYEAVSVGYDYELIYALGSFLGIGNPDEVLQLIEQVERLGLDAISTGVVLGWATEAYARKLVTLEQTIEPLAFGNAKAYLAAMEHIVAGKNQFYQALGLGAAAASERFGGQEFAMAFAKNEMPGYHTGYGSVVGSAAGARHSHLCNAGYALDQSMGKLDKEKMVDMLIKEEKERCMLNSLIICLFARKVYDRPTVLAALNFIGYNLSDEDLTRIGEKIYQTKLKVKQALGFDLKNVKLPKRAFETPTLNGQLEENTAYEMMEMIAAKNRGIMEKDI